MRLAPRWLDGPARAEAAGMLHNQHQRLESWQVRGAAALAAAIDDQRSSRALLAEAATAAHKLERARRRRSRATVGA